MLPPRRRHIQGPALSGSHPTPAPRTVPSAVCPHKQPATGPRAMLRHPEMRMATATPLMDPVLSSTAVRLWAASSIRATDVGRYCIVTTFTCCPPRLYSAGSLHHNDSRENILRRGGVAVPAGLIKSSRVLLVAGAPEMNRQPGKPTWSHPRSNGSPLPLHGMKAGRR